MITNKELSEDDGEKQKLTTYINFYKNTGIEKFFESNIDLEENISKITRKLTVKNALFKDASNESKKSLMNFIDRNFLKNPIDFYEEHKLDMISGMQAEVSKMQINIGEDEFSSFVHNIYDALSDEYIKRKAIFSGSLRMSQMLVKDYGMNNIIRQRNPEVTDTQHYDRFFKGMALNTMGLMPHQFEAVESFLAISDDVKLDMMMWEMRSGKTLAFLNSMWMQSLYRDETAMVLLETKNMNDITSQMLSHLPHMFASTNFVMPDSQSKDTILSEKNIYTRMPIAEMFPNLPVVLKPFYKGKGDMAKVEMERFSYEFEELMESVKEKGFTLEQMKEEYKESRFCGVLELCSKQ
jgi:hypothetical protein